LDTAEAANVSAQSALKAARERVKSANAALEQARARKTAAEAGLKQAVSRASAAQAGHSASSTSPQQIEISQAQKKIAAARLKQSIADILNAQLQLSYTRIMAPVSGIVSQKSIETGEFVQPGQPLMALVDLDSVWVVANFKETQIGRMKVGQPVVITVDSYPGRKLTGHVDSIGAATGAKFSLLPAENATGNFVKVVQRIPVKIVMDRPFPGGIVLRPGMNVTAKVHLVGGRG
jgi:membrane fusion protein (multidrug efflux system)